MGHITFKLSDEVEKKFRKATVKRLGCTKGALGKAVEKALQEWSEKELDDETLRKLAKEVGVTGIVSEIDGELKDVKGKTSVELQHEARRLYWHSAD